ncbi:MAG TPA: potassium-transporting ATPase subunit KdpA, partial [Acidimicrobiales bacterium]|nr:potassium-transporting ATPase subunit KdpA [Acidimicrobiales bacterium]
MTGFSWAQIAFVSAATAVLAPLGGKYLAATFSPGRSPGDGVFLPLEGLVYRVVGIDPDGQQRWTGYTFSVLAFGLASLLVLYGILRLQGHL